MKNTKDVFIDTVKSSKILTIGLIVTVIGAVFVSMLPPLVLEWIINRLTFGKGISFPAVILYFLLIAVTGLLESGREVELTFFGQRMTRKLREAMNQKLSRLSADTLLKLEPGATVSRMLGDVDTVESLFTSGIISMVSDLGRMISIFTIVFCKNRGLAIVLMMIFPLLFLLTRFVQKKSLQSQLAYRKAIARVSNHVPETIINIRSIHLLQKETYMEQRYRDYIEESYLAMEKSNFFDAIYSPIILIINAVVTATVFVLSASGIPVVQSYFGMSVGTAVAMISYITQVFGPIESIGMEIQTIQAAFAGVRRINEFLGCKDRWCTEDDILFSKDAPCVEFKGVSFGYIEEQEIVKDLCFVIQKMEHVTLTGRTGAGKSTIFKLLLGQYQPSQGKILIFGQEASLIPDGKKRELFGYVEQVFHPIPGTFADQIRLLDSSVTEKMIMEAAKLVGIHDTIMELEKGYDTPYRSELLSQGQRQLLSIARAVVANPEILLLDEITANLDADTEQTVLTALQNASKDRTVITISHRIYEKLEGVQIEIPEIHNL